MGFPITVGNKTFTSQDFEGRNYVYGYPQLLKEFEERASSNPAYLGFEIEQRIVPSYGSIVIQLPTAVDVAIGQVLDLEAPDGSYMGVFIDQTFEDGRVEGRVCFLSEGLRKPHDRWKVGLGQVIQQTTSQYDGFLEKRFDNLSKSPNRVLGAGYSYYNPGSRRDGSLGATIPSRNVLARVDQGNEGVIATAHIGSSISTELEAVSIPGNFEYIVDMWILDESDMYIYQLGGNLLKEGSTIKINSVAIPGSFPPGVLRKYRYAYNSSLSQITLWVDGTQIFQNSPVAVNSLISIQGKIKLHRLQRRFYNV